MWLHKEMAAGRWQTFSLMEQMANIGSDVIRAINWRAKGNEEYAQAAFERSLELFDLTAMDTKNHNHRLKEILRSREAWADYFTSGNLYYSTAEQWQKYFLAFNYAARRLT